MKRVRGKRLGPTVRVMVKNSKWDSLVISGSHNSQFSLQNPLHNSPAKSLQNSFVWYCLGPIATVQGTEPRISPSALLER